MENFVGKIIEKYQELMKSGAKNQCKIERKSIENSVLKIEQNWKEASDKLKKKNSSKPVEAQNINKYLHND